jgi:large subunit ribosomal protein L14e
VPAIQIGRICVKVNGNEAGKKCVIVDIIDKNYVLITGPKTITKVKRRRVNVNHIEPTAESLDITRGESDEAIMEKVKATGKLDELTSPSKPS